MKTNRYRYADSDPHSIYEVFTITELINRVAVVWHPWEIHRFEDMAVIHFLN